MKCQKCNNAATLHITEVIAESQFEELHLCEQCANKYLYEPQSKPAPRPPRPSSSKRACSASRSALPAA